MMTRTRKLQMIVKGFVDSRQQVGFTNLQVAEAITRIKRQMGYVKNLQLRANMKMVLVLKKEIDVLMPSTMVQQVHSLTYDRYMRNARRMKAALEQCEKELQLNKGGEQLKIAS